MLCDFQYFVILNDQYDLFLFHSDILHCKDFKII